MAMDRFHACSPILGRLRIFIAMARICFERERVPPLCVASLRRGLRAQRSSPAKARFLDKLGMRRESSP
jgi:hypothetical protein